jgi:hypothetical protein
VADRVVHVPGRPVLNFAVGLKDSLGEKNDTGDQPFAYLKEL